MTTFQDPPPQSRRAVRQSERADAPVEGTPTAPAQGVPYSFDANTGSTPEQPSSAPAAPQSGRRAQARVAPPADGYTSQPLANQPPPGAVSGGHAGETPEQAAYRMRDFSPEGRRSAAHVPSPSASFGAPARPVELDYQTQGVPPGASHVAAPAPVDEALNHTLSRRELREMRAAAEAQAPALQVPPASLTEPIDALLNSGPIDIPTLAPPPGQSQALAEAMAEFDLLTRSRREAEARARDAQVASLATPIVPQQAPVSVPSVPELVLPMSAPTPSAPPPPVQQLPFEQASVPQAPEASVPQPPEASVPRPLEASAPQAPVAYPPTASLPSPPVPQASVPVAQASVPQPPEASSVESAPTGEHDQYGGRSPRASGHWRVQAAKEDDELPYENTLSRTVGSNTSAITTSALVLPSVPQPDRILNTMTSTGEILVTGTIDLPSTLGSTGAHPGRIDNSDYEDDPLDSQVAAPDSAPIRAIRAVSTNTSTRGVIETKKPNGTRMLTAVITVASVLCVGLVGLLVFAFVSGKL